MGNVYLGVNVSDIGKKGLSNKKEFEEIIKAILSDYNKGKITKKIAKGRLLLLYHLTYKKNNSNLRISRKTASEIRKIIRSMMKVL